MARTIIYHAGCIDGFTAAWCAWLKFRDEPADAPDEYVAANYGDAPPDVAGRDVLIVDFSYPRDVLLGMKERAASLRVLDHHKTAEAALAGLDFCTFDMKRSGAGLAWDELFGVPRRALVSYVEDRDLWSWKLESSREVSAYIATVERTFDEWTDLADEIEYSFDTTVIAGCTALRVTEQYVDSIAKHPGRAVIGGHSVPIVNTTFAVSELVGKLAESAPFAVGWFEKDDGKIVYSLRSRGPEGLDVSEIAKSYGGGGHRNAAGFTTNHPIHRQCEPTIEVAQP